MRDQAEVHQVSRPRTADQVRAALLARIERAREFDRLALASQGARGLVVAKLEEALAPADDVGEERRGVTAWLLGKGSSKGLTIAEASALLAWLLDGRGRLDPHAPAEAAAALAAGAEATRPGRAEPIEGGPAARVDTRSV